MGRAGQRWARRVEPHFSYLIDHGFTQITTDDTSHWSLWVRYASQHAAVQIAHSNEFGRVEVELIRLVDGEVPPYSIWITSKKIDWALLDTILEVRDPKALERARLLSGLDTDDLERQLTFWAQTLRRVAPDFLQGSMAALDEAEQVVRRRVAEQPQEVVAWIPADTPPTAEAEKRAELEATVPDEVTVRVRRYDPRRRHGT